MAYMTLTIEEDLNELKTLQDAFNSSTNPIEYVAIFKTLHNKAEKLANSLKQIDERDNLNKLVFNTVVKKYKR